MMHGPIRVGICHPHIYISGLAVLYVLMNNPAVESCQGPYDGERVGP